MKPKEIIKDILALAGLKISRISTGKIAGTSLWEDLRLIVLNDSPVCFDIGANAGQTLDSLLENFASPIIHAFEPSTAQFQELSSRDFGKTVTLHNCAMGGEQHVGEFINYDISTMSSFLALDQAEENGFRHLSETGREIVHIDTVDNFMNANHIKILDLLKTDTQGFDLEVLKGARESFEKGSIKNVLIEINFIRMYAGQASHMQILEFLTNYEFQLVDLYEKVRQGSSLAWCTALFSRK